MTKEQELMEELLSSYLKELKEGRDPCLDKYLRDYPYPKKHLRELLGIARSAYRGTEEDFPRPSPSFFFSLREKLIQILREEGLIH